ncbi:unnamed protein product [Trichobilharzia regenti]|nr:unnamed protein product [Trichobilharzia regenti]
MTVLYVENESEKQAIESSLEVKQLNTLLHEKQMKLEHTERRLTEMESHLNSAEQYTQSLSSANEDLMNELKNRTNELEKLQKEIKQNMTGIQNSELMVNKLKIVTLIFSFCFPLLCVLFCCISCFVYLYYGFQYILCPKFNI